MIFSKHLIELFDYFILNFVKYFLFLFLYFFSTITITYELMASDYKN